MGRQWEPMLEHVVRERYQRLLGHALLLCRSTADAQDLVQDALVSTFGGRARFATAAEAEQYVRRAIVSRFLDESRRRTRERSVVERSAARIEHVPEPMPGIGADVRRALADLAPRERACVVLRQLDDLSVRETAALLGLSEGAVKRYTSDGIARVGAALGDVTTHDDVVAVRPTSSTRGVRHDG
ncbi:sigma-70 family RNA polymerase sigma factor [Cellulomonas sp.]|uniref:sigma-70 family RNA polymerase sigma factor n=1 Tax=Cellulomonas sp. TaxID=40001 RepID=UPI003BA85BB8